jgi:hypothetical protein
MQARERAATNTQKPESIASAGESVGMTFALFLGYLISCLVAAIAFNSVVKGGGMLLLLFPLLPIFLLALDPLWLVLWGLIFAASSFLVWKWLSAK